MRNRRHEASGLRHEPTDLAHAQARVVARAALVALIALYAPDGAAARRLQGRRICAFTSCSNGSPKAFRRRKKHCTTGRCSANSQAELEYRSARQEHDLAVSSAAKGAPAGPSYPNAGQRTAGCQGFAFARRHGGGSQVNHRRLDGLRDGCPGVAMACLAPTDTRMWFIAIAWACAAHLSRVTAIYALQVRTRSTHTAHPSWLTKVATRRYIAMH